MRFELDRLGPDSFEQMIQSLIHGKEPQTIICGDGPDGQREFFIRGAQFEVLSGRYATGYTVGQVKFKSPDGSRKDWTWLQKELRDELDGFRSKQKTSPEKVPQTYLFFTNLVLTPSEDSGLRDKAEHFINGYRDLIPNIQLYGADDIRAMLENNRDVARSYASFILPGDVLDKLDEYLSELSCQKTKALIEYVRQTFREDAAVHLEQAGGILDKSINIRNVYTDLEVKTENNSEENGKRIAEYLISLGDQTHRRTTLLTERPWNPEQPMEQNANNLLLVGDAGQGKSTVSQYICQIYRACLLKRLCCQEHSWDEYFQNAQDCNVPVPKCERFPMMVSLKRYAKWIQDQGEDGNASVLAYLSYLIHKKSASAFDLNDLQSLLSGFSWLFIFDGLDEVPASSNRGEVLHQIELFMNTELTGALCDSIVFFTSRPQGLDQSITHRKFRQFRLQEMSKPLCREYLDRLLVALEDNEELREQYQATLLKALEDKTTSRLMTTPLYTAIVVLLVKSGGTPPKKRYDLFKEYCDVVIKREKQKDLLPQVNGETGWVRQLHAKIGFLLQTESENAENAAAELSTGRCKAMIGDYLKLMEADPSLTDTIYYAMTARLPFLAEVVGDDDQESVLFPLRSIQEYFAAEWLINFQDDETRLRALTMISVSAYWRNVYLFVNGHFARLNYYVMKHGLLGICRDNNGDAEAELADPEAQRITLQGSRLALDVLQDEPFSRPGDWRPYLELSAKLLNRTDQQSDTADRFLELPQCYENELLKWVIPIVKRTKSTGCDAFFVLWGLANRGNQKAFACLEQLVEVVTLDSENDVARLIMQGYQGVGAKALSRLFHWVTEDAFLPYTRHPFIRDDALFSFLAHCIHIWGAETVRPLAVRCVAYCSDIGLRPTDALPDTLRPLFGNAFPPEFEALRQFHELPDYSSFSALLRAYFDLSETVRKSFLKLDSWDSRVFANVLNGASSRFLSAEEALFYYTPQKFQEIMVKKQALTQLAEQGDVIAFTQNGGWEFGLNLLTTDIISDSVLLNLLDVAEERLEQAGLVDYIAGQIGKRDTLSPKIKNWVMRHFPELANSNSYDSYRILDRISELIKPTETAFEQIRFPRSCNYYHIYDDFCDLIRDYLRLVRYKPAMIEAYSLLAFRDEKTKALSSLLPEDIVGAYHQLKAIGNPLALGGFLCCLLTTDLNNEMVEMVTDDLAELVNDRSLYVLLIKYYELFTMPSKTLFYSIAKEHSESHHFSLSFLTWHILEALEHTPIDRTALLALSEQGHSDD